MSAQKVLNGPHSLTMQSSKKIPLPLLQKKKKKKKKVMEPFGPERGAFLVRPLKEKLPEHQVAQVDLFFTKLRL